MVLSQHVSRRYATELLKTADRGSGNLLKECAADLGTFADDLRDVVGGCCCRRFALRPAVNVWARRSRERT